MFLTRTAPWQTIWPRHHSNRRLGRLQSALPDSHKFRAWSARFLLDTRDDGGLGLSGGSTGLSRTG